MFDNKVGVTANGTKMVLVLNFAILKTEQDSFLLEFLVKFLAYLFRNIRVNTRTQKYT